MSGNQPNNNKPKRETSRARQAFEDYYNLGGGRSLQKLTDHYRQSDAKTTPTKLLRTLKTWSATWGWQERVGDRDKMIAQLALEALKDEAINSRYYNHLIRMRDLNEIAEEMYNRIIQTSGRPVSLAKLRQIVPLFRGLLDDIAAELGGRKKHVDVTTKGEAIKGYATVNPDDWPNKKPA